jgi:hypothetical protein
MILMYDTPAPGFPARQRNADEPTSGGVAAPGRGSQGRREPLGQGIPGRMSTALIPPSA